MTANSQPHIDALVSEVLMRTRRKYYKPWLRRIDGRWVCSIREGIERSGATPLEAYQNWLMLGPSAGLFSVKASNKTAAEVLQRQNMFRLYG